MVGRRNKLLRICKLLSKWCKALQVDNPPNIGGQNLNWKCRWLVEVKFPKIKNAKSKSKKLSEIPTHPSNYLSTIV